MLAAGIGPLAAQPKEPRLKPARSAEAERPASRPQPPAAGRADKSEEIIVTRERAAAALAFARQHHPELADLLRHLNDAHPLAYRRAIRELYQTSERLARQRERSPERYELALKAWKLDSRIRLLAARMTMTDDPALEAELRDALQARLDAKREQLQFERDRAAERVQMLESSLDAIQRDPAAALDREYERVTRGLRKTRKAVPADDSLKQN
jgi:hypothetical protein